MFSRPRRVRIWSVSWKFVSQLESQWQQGGVRIICFAGPRLLIITYRTPTSWSVLSASIFSWKPGLVYQFSDRGVFFYLVCGAPSALQVLFALCLDAVAAYPTFVPDHGRTHGTCPDHRPGTFRLSVSNLKLLYMRSNLYHLA